ncbi:MAG: glycosyltransferase family 2 protein, partial [Eubacteriales bacterium]|nr:glycosyltransferase family 2 protein [Eubacteriales bacterium]
MTEPLISVIVPVYRVEEYLPRCVESLLGQTYQNLEILLVDDGSPDGCPALCDRYAGMDGRVRAI